MFKKIHLNTERGLLVGKYTVTSATATSLDFITSYIFFHLISISSLWSTVSGRVVGAIVAFVMHRYWVFKAGKQIPLPVLLPRYLAAVALGMVLNVAGTEFFFKIIRFDYMVARFLTAVSAWLVVFLFNKIVVFRK